MKKSLLLAICFLVLADICPARNVLTVRKLSSKEQLEYLAQFAKIKFRNDSMFIFNTANEIISQNALVNVQVMIFNEDEEEPVPSSIDDVTTDALRLSVFPNPATYSIRVENYEALQNISVYSLTGEPVVVESTIDDTRATVNVSSLEAGTYIMLINQTAVKFIKQ